MTIGASLPVSSAPEREFREYGAHPSEPAAPNDDEGMSDREPRAHDGGDALLVLYDRSLPQVFGYLVRRCPSEALAEDLTAETFLAAVDAVRKGRGSGLTTGWLITVARNKLVDHWRRAEREQRGLQLMVAPEPVPEADDRIGDLDPSRALAVLDDLGPHHRVALTLRYLDGLPVPQVADHLDRTVHATEALLVRARVAFRRAYDDRMREEGSDDDA
jgi:RNA polymerase sigma-70 factor (ECF subfamily)